MRGASLWSVVRPALVNPSKILSVGSIFNRDDLASVHIEVLCSLCDEVDTVVVTLKEPGDLSWLWRHDFYFVCGRHRPWAAN